MALSWFSKKPKQSIEQFEQAIEHSLAQRAEISHHKDQTLKRQVELWSITNPSPELEAEYRNTASRVAIDASKLLAIDEHLNLLRKAKFKVEQGTKEDISDLLAVVDPTVNATPSLAPVRYAP